MEPGLERARLVAGAIRAMQTGDIDAGRGVAAHGLFRDDRRFVDRIVQHLDLEEFAGIVEPADRLDQAFGDVHLVVDGKLNRDPRQRVKRPQRRGLAILVLHVQVDEVIAMPPVHRQNDEHEEIEDKRERFNGGHTESAPAVCTVRDYTAGSSRIDVTSPS